MDKKRIILLIGAALFIVASVWLFISIRPQPRYNGKTVRELSRLTSMSPSERQLFGVTDEEAREALNILRRLGPRGEEALVRQLQLRETYWSQFYKTNWHRLPLFVKQRFPFENRTFRRQTAAKAIGQLGVLSPEMEHALVTACHDPDFIVRECAALVLGYKGSRSPETVHALEAAMREPLLARRVGEAGPSLIGVDFTPKTTPDMILDLDRPFPEARYVAASALCELGSNAPLAVPALIKALEDTDLRVRICCARALGRIGPAASNAVPGLQSLLTDETTLARSAAGEAIQQIKKP